MRLTIKLDGAFETTDAAEIVAALWEQEQHRFANNIRLRGISRQDKDEVWYTASRLFDAKAAARKLGNAA
jgi:hypothetical protein